VRAVRRLRLNCWIGLLLACMMGAQWLALAHSVLHARGLARWAPVAVVDDGRPAHAGWIERLLGRHDDALAAWEALVQTTPGLPQVHHNIGSAYFTLGRHADAVAAYDRALALMPDHRQTLHNRVAALSQLARFEEALATCDRLLALDPLAEDAVRALEGLPVGKGMVFSSAYLYGMADLKLPRDSVGYWMRRENEFTAAEVAKAPDRLVGVMSVDPLAPTALEEIAHWKGNPAFRALKMHLFGSRVHLADPAERARLADGARASRAELSWERTVADYAALIERAAGTPS